MTELLRNTQDVALRNHRLSVLHQSANHLQAVVNDLIDLARLDAHRLELHVEPVSPEAQVNDVTGLLEALAEGKGLALRQRVDADVAQAVSVDAARLRQVLFNLVGNALKFTHEGHVEVHVQVPPGGQPGSLRFTVSDTGEGIPPESLDRVFEAFEQAGPEAAARRTGAGLGLTISRQLARAMGGDICCRSVIGEGTTFEFDVCAPACEPPHIAEPDVVQANPAVGAAATLEPAPPSPAIVLVADDNPINAMVAEGMLEQLGIRADMARDGLMALSMLEQSTYGVVLMDCMMPNLDGYEATRRWRARESERGAGRLPIIALTANAVAGDRETCLAAGMDDYLAKPFTLTDLSAVLRRHMALPVATRHARA
jgi:CheY-like chemotaxis protein/anti-sigma regulatory factor (Ser/Thr protein kinase)